MSVVLVSDSCHYMPAEMASAIGLHEVSLYVHRGGVAQPETEITDYAEYYRRLAGEPELPTTSQPSIGDFLAVYQPLIDAGHEIISIHLAGGMSGTVRSAEQARDQLGDAASRVHVIDSGTACGGQALMLLGAAAALRDGADAAGAVARAHQVRERLKVWFVVDTLEYLRRGGRIAGAQAWVGTALKIKPILSVDSEITPVERVRTSRRAFERIVELMRGLHDEGCDAWVIQHIQAPDVVAGLVERGREIFGNDPLYIAEIGPVIGTHVGPGLFGAGGVPSSLIS